MDGDGTVFARAGHAETVRAPPDLVRGTGVDFLLEDELLVDEVVVLGQDVVALLRVGDEFRFETASDDDDVDLRMNGGRSGVVVDLHAVDVALLSDRVEVDLLLVDDGTDDERVLVYLNVCDGADVFVEDI